MDDCKALYKSIQDSQRYKRKRIQGKSGDSGNEMSLDETSKGGDDSKDCFAFLTPTSSKFPRTTMSMGAGSSSKLTYDPEMDDSNTNSFDPDDSSQTSGSSVYSYSVSIVLYNIYLTLDISIR